MYLQMQSNFDFSFFFHYSNTNRKRKCTIELNFTSHIECQDNQKWFDICLTQFPINRTKKKLMNAIICGNKFGNDFFSFSFFSSELALCISVISFVSWIFHFWIIYWIFCVYDFDCDFAKVHFIYTIFIDRSKHWKFSTN